MCPGAVNPRHLKTPGRHSRYYRCAKFRAEYEIIQATGGCPYPRCLEGECPSYLHELPSGRPIDLRVDEKRVSAKHDCEITRRRCRQSRIQKYRDAHASRKANERDRVLVLGYVPSPQSKYYRCARFKFAPFVCPIPKKHCVACPHHLKGSLRHGNKRSYGMYDWDDPEEKKTYFREYMKDYRAKQKKEALCAG